MLRFELTFDAHRSLAQYRGRTGRMPDDLDHEVIDSPQALFRHLYEAHGLVEALDLDPATAPLQFWLRKHAELERSTARAVVQDRMATVPDRPPASGRHPLPRRSTAEGGSVGLSLGTPTAALATPPPAGGGARSRGPANPGAVPDARSHRPRAHRGTPPRPPRPLPRGGAPRHRRQRRREPRRQRRSPRPGWRSSRRGGQREPAAPPRTTPPAASPPASGPPSRPEPDDDFMTLADALQRRHGDRRR